MAIDNHGLFCCCGHRCWNLGWDLASPRVFIIYIISVYQVQSSYELCVSLAYSYSPPTPQNPNPAPSPNITPAVQFILNDTSLAALVLPNGDRQLFFQDSTGHIRRTGRTASNSQWSTSPWLNTSTGPYDNVPVPIKPKDHSPLALGISADPSSSTAIDVLFRG